MGIKRVWICEKEEAERKKILRALKASQWFQGEILGFASEKQVRSRVSDIRSMPDLVFMSTEFSQNGGIYAAQKIAENWGEIPVIFMSEEVREVEQIFEADPAYFLKKPIQPECLHAALEWGRQHGREQRRKEAVVVMRKGGLHRILCSRLQYVESHRRVATFAGEGRSYSVYMKLDELEEILPEKFLRCHKSYLVNMDFIRKFTMENVYLFSGQKIPVSRGKYRKAREKYLNYLSGSSRKEG